MNGAAAQPPVVLALFGPTGVGKTAIAVALAAALRARGDDPVAIGADALQVYRGLELLTGAPTATERERLEHRLVAFLEPSQTFSAGQYAPLAHACIDEALAAGRTPIVVGGTGLYMLAGLCSLDLRPPPDPATRARLLGELDNEGAAALHARLDRRDPESATAIAPTDRTRIVRALELLEAGERPPAAGELWDAAPRHPTLIAGLTMERAALYERIDERVRAMVAAGAADEVRRAERAGVSVTARKALGFEELLADDTEAMARRTRNYAKRQLTWMRRLPAVVTIDATALGPSEVASAVVAHAEADET